MKFIWTELHQKEFDYVIKNLSKLKFLYPYLKGNKLYAMTDASLSSLGFILYQKDPNSHCSIIQVGSTCLKNVQARWHPAELELLAFQYCLKKCHFYTAHSDDVIEIQSNCSRLRNFQLQEIIQLQNSRMIQMKVNLQMYNYTVSHVKGVKNHLADVLSCRPVWLAPDISLGPIQGLDLDEDNDFAIRVMESKTQLL